MAAAAVLLSPFVPLLFMGEEYGETAPFPYFVSHGDPALLRAVRDGRRAEVGAGAPDPGDEATFLSAKLDPALRLRPPHDAVLAVHRELLRLRRERPALAASRGPDGSGLEAVALEDARALVVRRWAPLDEVALVLAFDGGPLSAPLPAGRWRALFDSEDPRWAGAGPALAGAIESAGVLELAAPTPRALLLARERA